MPTPKATKVAAPAATEMAADRELPNDFDSEQAVIGSILLEPKALERALATVRPSDFYRPFHQTIMKAALCCHLRGEPVDLVTVSAELRRCGALEEVGGGEYLTAIIGQVPTAAHVGRYANIVAEKAVLRRLIRAGQDIQDMAYANPEDVGAVLERAAALTQPLLERLLAPPSALQPRTLQQVLDETVAVECYWPDRLVYGHINLVVGPNGAGKSFLMLELLRALTTGSAWPDGTSAPRRGTALWLDYELMEGATAARASRMGLPTDAISVQALGPLPYLTRPGGFGDHPSLVALDPGRGPVHR